MLYFFIFISYEENEKKYMHRMQANAYFFSKAGMHSFFYRNRISFGGTLTFEAKVSTTSNKGIKFTSVDFHLKFNRHLEKEGQL